MEEVLSTELVNISQWLSDNKLSLHLGKTESILFGSRAKLAKFPGFNIKVDSSEVTSKTSVRYLGCELDRCLSGESMAQIVLSKINHKIKFLARISKFLDCETLNILAGSLVQCHFDYAFTSWYSSTSKQLKTKLQTSQNKLLRTVRKFAPHTHLDPDNFKQLGWLPVGKRVTQIRLGLVHRIVNNTAPRYLTSYFRFIRDVHKYNTRSRDSDIHCVQFKSNFGKNAFLYTGAVEWNNMPLHIKSIQGRNTFKRKVKSWLMNETE